MRIRRFESSMGIGRIGVPKSGTKGRVAMSLTTEVDGRWHMLRSATRETHERLDRRIMAAGPFESRERYGRFVAIQYRFHAGIDDLYVNPSIDAILPDLGTRRRLTLIEQDLSDLEIDVQAFVPVSVLSDGVDVPTALGWLYVAEGSNLGAAFLLKAAAKLGLSESFGARHLAGHPDGRGLHWRRFTTALDAAELTSTEEERAIAGAQAAFRCVHGFVEELLPL